MRKAVAEVIRECAYCARECDYEGVGYCKWGQVDLWRCPMHGIFQEMSEPLRLAGQQIR